jgi:hypothetical protein
LAICALNTPRSASNFLILTSMEPILASVCDGQRSSSGPVRRYHAAVSAHEYLGASKQKQLTDAMASVRLGFGLPLPDPKIWWVKDGGQQDSRPRDLNVTRLTRFIVIGSGIGQSLNT